MTPWRCSRVRQLSSTWLPKKDRVQTDPFFEDGEKVVGREDAVTKIVTTLISSDNQQKNLSVMAIVGMAGLGKTTLAKSVYNEPAIDKHFPKRIWVCVSNTFEVDTILSLMVDSLVPGKAAGMKSRHALLQVLREEITGKRYVLVLGGLLRSKARKVAEWLSIRDNRLWELPEGEDRIMKVLKLSFDNLEPSPLKQCFAYCSMLGKDFEIERDNLIQLWMAQGLLQTSSVENHHEMELTGEVYFNILLNNSLFQEVIEGGTVTKYTMHDLVHDLAEKVSKSERLTHESNDDVPHVARSSPSTLENMSEVTVGRLRSLFSNDQVPEIIFSKFKAMRVLSLDTADIEELPNSLGKLKHLRYLDLSYTRIKALPKSIGKLYNLQTLRMQDCDLNKLPREMQNLINLKKLVLLWISGFHNLESIPRLEECTSLRRFEVGHCDKLKFLQTGLSCLARLEDLELGPFREDLDSFPDFQVPSQQLVSLVLNGWPKLKSLPQQVQHLTSLTRLTIDSFHGVEILPEWLGNFASLMNLSIYFCDNLKYLPSLEAMQRLTKLEFLYVFRCPLLEQRCTEDSGEEWPKISHIPRVTCKQASL
ncbi:hypothetical protein ACLB2K_058156 [Fragaria x ananassa]